MGVEGGSVGIGGAIGGVGTAVSVGPAISVAPSIGSISALSELGSVIGRSDIGPISSGGSAVPSFSLTDTMPYKLNSLPPVGQIVFNNLGNYEAKPLVKPEISPVVPATLNAADVISEAESILAEARTEPAIIRQAEQVAQAAWNMPLEGNIKPADQIQTGKVLQVATQAGIKPEIARRWVADTLTAPAVVRPRIETIFVPEPNLVTRAVNKLALEPTTKTESASVAQPALQPQADSKASIETEEVIEEKVLAEESKSELTEETAEDKSSYLVDERVSEQRKYEIKEAIKKAKIEIALLGLKKITGWLVAKFLPAEHEGNRSQIVKKKGPDGSYQETIEAIASIGEFTSEQQAEERSGEIVAEKTPVKKGKQGRKVGIEAVVRVFKYRLVKAVAIEIIKKRHNHSSVLITEKPQVKKELDIEDLELTEVFQKTAA